MTATSVSKSRRTKQTQEERDQIVLDHLSLVKAIAIRVHENLPVHVDLDDLIHAGVMGLFDAVTKYDGTKNVAFHSYAKHRIKGAILDSLRQLDWASRDLRRRHKQVEATTRDLSSKLGRTPNDLEIADQLGVGLDRWHRIQLEMRTVGVVSSTPNPDQDRDRTVLDPLAEARRRPGLVAAEQLMRGPGPLADAPQVEGSDSSQPSKDECVHG
jgi:RNA polymerase sigma factor for flagellar operon FliA